MIVSCPSCQRNYVVADEQIAGKQFRARCKSCGVEFRLDGTPTQGTTDDTAPNDAPKFMSATEAYLALQSIPPQPNAPTWSVCLSKTDTRRMTADEIVQSYTSGKIDSSAFVWKTGMPKWLRLSDVSELTQLIVKAGGKVPKGSEAAAKDAAAKAAEAKAAAGRSKPPPPARTVTLAMGSQPPVPTPSGSIAPRSGQTMPPPSPFASEPPPTSTTVGPTNAAPSAEAKAADGKPTDAKAPAKPGASISPPGATRRNTPSPPLRQLDIPVEVEVAPPPEPKAPAEQPVAAAPPTAKDAGGSSSAVSVDAAGASNGSVGVVLPPLKAGGNGASAPGSTAAIAAAAALGQKRSEPPPKASAVPAASTAASSTATTAVRESTPPPSEKRAKPMAGVIAAVSAVGLLGVLGGVAGAVYVMKSTLASLPTPTAASVVALQPQAATPIPNPTPVEGAPAARTGVSAVPGSVVNGDALAADSPTQPTEKPSSSKGATGPASIAAPRTASGAKVASRAAEPPSFAAAVDAKAAKASSGASMPPAPAAAPAPASAPGAAPFNRDSALAVLGVAAARAPSCKKADGPSGPAKVYVTFDPNGTVVIANVVGAPIAGTSVAQCVANIFRRVKVPPFSGDRTSVSKDINIP